MRVIATCALLLITLAASPACAEDQGWLGLVPATPGSPPAVSGEPGMFGLLPVPSEPTPYLHPFSPEVHRLSERVHAEAPRDGRVYLIRTAPGPEHPRENYHFVRHLTSNLHLHGLRALAAPPQGGIPRTPLMAVAHFSRDEATEPPPGWLEMTEVEAARVRLSILVLPADPAAVPQEIPLLESSLLSPAAALGRAAAVFKETRQRLVPASRLDRETLLRLWPEAMAHAARASDDSLVLALRVLWRAGELDLPGPGGVMVRAVDEPVAHERLHRLFEPRPR